MCGTAAFAHCMYPTTLVLMSLEQELVIGLRQWTSHHATRRA